MDVDSHISSNRILCSTIYEMNMMDYDKYILPLNGSLEGTGVLVGNLFITAGHVVVGCAGPFIVISGVSYYLSANKRIFIDDNPSKSSEGFDLAIYRLDCIGSPLVLADDVPNKIINLVSLSSHTVVTRTSPGIFGLHQNRVLERINGKVTDYFDNYFECKMESELCTGRSGSPLLSGNEVVGILYGDKNGKDRSNTVLYLSSKAIVELLTKEGYGK